MLHKTVVEIPNDQFPALGKVMDNSSSGLPPGIGASLHQGNKVATLMGDFLLAKSSKELSHLETAEVTVGMSESIADFTESEVIVCEINDNLDRLKQLDKTHNASISEHGQPLVLTNFLNYDKWLHRSQLSIGSLLGHSCFGSLVLGGHEDDVSNLAFSIGTKIGLAIQVLVW
jgi:decaprenyl-diphosphate synthase subunit 2